MVIINSTTESVASTAQVLFLRPCSCLLSWGCRASSTLLKEMEITGDFPSLFLAPPIVFANTEEEFPEPVTDSPCKGGCGGKQECSLHIILHQSYSGKSSFCLCPLLLQIREVADTSVPFLVSLKDIEEYVISQGRSQWFQLNPALKWLYKIILVGPSNKQQLRKKWFSQMANCPNFC